MTPRLAISNLGLFILVGGSLLLAGAITSTQDTIRRGGFFPKTAAGKIIAAVLAILVVGFLVWMLCLLAKEYL